MLAVIVLYMVILVHQELPKQPVDLQNADQAPSPKRQV